jgi:acetyltransferase-like isoleucine patch superfamily enzyme
LNTQSFDTGSVDWLPITNSGNQDTNWELGAPAFGSTSSAAPNAWDINLNTGYNYSATLYTASFNISNITQKHYLSFMLNYKTEAGWDRIEYSNDFALTWQVLGMLDPQGFNWYTDNSLNSSGLPAWEGNSNGWVPCYYYLNPSQIGSNMIFRFVFNSDAAVNSDGVSIDDFYFGSLPAKDAAFIGFNNSVDTFMTGNAIPTSVILENRGAQNLMSLSISHDVNGTIGSTLFTGNVIPFLPVIINVSGVIAQEGKNILTTYVDDSLDLNSQNDTIVRYVYGFSRKPIPYIESFEGPLPNGWFAVASQNQVNWERGIPTFGVTNSAHSGDNVWDVALNASYRTQQNDTLYSPVFRTLGLSNLQLSFWINYQTYFGHAGVHLQCKIASNNLWKNVDTLLQLSPYSGTMFNGEVLGQVIHLDGDVDSEGFITRLEEKPTIPKSNLALVGIYRFREAGKLMEALDHIVRNNIRHQGEFHLTYGIQRMITQGEKVTTFQVGSWFDCGSKANLLETNEVLLKKHSEAIHRKFNFHNTIIIHPVSIAEHCDISDSIIGPNVSIGEHTIIKHSVIKDSIIGAYAHLETAILHQSIVGSDAFLKGLSQSLNIGDSTEIDFS